MAKKIFNKPHVSGSALLLVLFMTTALLLACATVWHSTLFVAQSMQKRVEIEQQSHLLNAVLTWGVAFGRTHYQSLIKQPSFEYDLGVWPAESAHKFASRLFYQVRGKDILVKGTVSCGQKGQAVRQGSCLLVASKDADKPMTISVRNWQCD